MANYQPRDLVTRAGAAADKKRQEKNHVLNWTLLSFLKASLFTCKLSVLAITSLTKYSPNPGDRARKERDPFSPVFHRKIFVLKIFAENSKHFSVLNNFFIPQSHICKRALIGHSVRLTNNFGTSIKVIKYVEDTLSIVLWTQVWAGYDTTQIWDTLMSKNSSWGVGCTYFSLTPVI